MTCNNCDKSCGKCGNPCGCAEPVFSVQPMDDDPTVYRFNTNGKSVLADLEPAVKAGETCTTIGINTVDRVLKFNGECGEQSITAKEIGSIIHLGDLGDVNIETINDNGILNYRKDNNCPEGCEATGDGWVSSNPVEVSGSSLSYVLGSDADGKMASLMPPADTTTHSILTWTGAGKVQWHKPNVAATAPVDGDGKVWRLYVDPSTYELTIVKENP